MKLRTRKLVVGLVAVVIAAGAGVGIGVTLGRHQPSPPMLTPAATVVCANVDDTAALQTAVSRGGLVTIGPGTCALTGHISVRQPGTVIGGAGPTQTFLVQHNTCCPGHNENIFDITADNVTVRDMNLDTATFDPGTPCANNCGTVASGVLYSGGVNNTHVSDVVAKAGAGYGMRFVGGHASCTSRTTIGPTLTNITVTSTGKGGYAAVDVSCNTGASLTGITIHGGILAFYEDSDASLNGETFTPGPNNIPCEPAFEVHGTDVNIAIQNVVSHGGPGRVKLGATNVTVTNQTVLSACGP